ncbi:pseudouridine synthase [Laceyella putida]|uniref:Pseudouridine synthase n=1 Tax=Laceyella putida TaxID=110101 RepID=A0ABW2RMF0_9BACL
MERLQKVLAHAGVASRRHSEELIKSGKVKVNGKVVTQLGVKVDPAQDQIEVNGQLIQQEQKRTFLFYKPLRVITSMSDPQGRKVVADYFRSVPERIYPVGRLDYDTEGLLLLTNDGELANRLIHPRYEVDKTYVATVKGRPSPAAIEQLRKGVKLEDGWTAPAGVRILSQDDTQTKLQLTIREGRNRQVRRMCDAVGHPVIHLMRTKLAFLTLEGLKRGEYRELTGQEQERLRRLLT